MEVILRQNVKGLGKTGNRVKVADGYARNFLIPKGLAVPANEQMVIALKNEKSQEILKKDREIKKARELSELLSKTTITINKQATDGDKLFGSVTVSDILKCLEDQGIALEKRQILLPEPIKTLGLHPIKIKLASDIESVLKIWVEK